jgi:hypothetical protein
MVSFKIQLEKADVFYVHLDPIVQLLVFLYQLLVLQATIVLQEVKVVLKHHVLLVHTLI